MRSKFALLLTLVVLTYLSEVGLPGIAHAQKRLPKTRPPCKSAEEVLSEFSTLARLPVAPDEIMVIGQVRSPGARALVKPATLMQLIAEAGGSDPKAASGIYIFRRALRREKRKSIFVDLKMIERGKEQDFVVEGGDIVYVPEACFIPLPLPQGDAVRTTSPSVAGVSAKSATRLPNH